MKVVLRDGTIQVWEKRKGRWRNRLVLNRRFKILVGQSTGHWELKRMATAIAMARAFVNMGPAAIEAETAKMMDAYKKQVTEEQRAQAWWRRLWRWLERGRRSLKIARALRWGHGNFRQHSSE